MKVLATNGLDSVESIQITLNKPIRPMLAERVRSSEEALERLHGKAGAEYKLDGERIQIHKRNENVNIFSRRLERITDHYPEVIDAIKLIKVESLIMEAEVVAINPSTEEFLPFQELMHRRRKYGIKQAIENYPVAMIFFDLLYVNGVDKTCLTYLQRRKLLEKMIYGLKDNRIRLVQQTIVTQSEQIDKFMSSAIEIGCEGLMVKQLSSMYRAGAREFAWMKLKREYRSELADTLDLVIVGALYGRGRRVGKYGIFY